MATTKGGKSESLVGTVRWVTSAENALVRQSQAQGLLTDGLRVLCYERAGGLYKYVPLRCVEAGVWVYPDDFKFLAEAMGTPTTWQPTEDEFYLLRGKQVFTGPSGGPHPLYQESPPSYESRRTYHAQAVAGD